MAVQKIMRLKKRHILVNLPESEEVVELTTPNVASTHLSQTQITHLKRQLARQIGQPRVRVEAGIAARRQQILAPLPSNDQDDGDWHAALWQ